MFLIGLPFLLESPRWLAQQGKREKAEANLCKLRKLPADHVYIQEEMAMIDRALANERADVGPSFWGPFKGVFGNRFMFQRMLLGTSLCMLDFCRLCPELTACIKNQSYSKTEQAVRVLFSGACIF